MEKINSEELINSISCPICFDNFSLERIPICLKCGHTICIICLEESLEKNEDDEDTESDEEKIIEKCLVCRRKIKTKIKDIVLNLNILNATYASNLTDRYVFCSNCVKLYDFVFEVKQFAKCVINKHSMNNFKSLMDILTFLNCASKSLNNNMSLKLMNLLSLMSTHIADVKTSIIEKIFDTFEESLFNKICIISDFSPDKLAKENYNPFTHLIKLENQNFYKAKKDLYKLRRNMDMYTKLRTQKKNDSLSMITTAFIYHGLELNKFEKIYSVQFVQDTKTIILLNAREIQTCPKSISLTIKEFPDVLNSSIAMEVNSTCEEIYFVGGSFGHSEKRSNNFYTFDIKNKRLEKKQNISTKLKEASILYKENKLYLIGGKIKNDVDSKHCEYFDFLLNKWRDLPKLNLELSNPTLCSVDERIYVCGNYAQTNSIINYLDLNEDAKWNKLNVSVDVCLAGNIFAPISRNKFILFGGTIVDEDDFSMYYNDKYYIIDIENETVLEQESKLNNVSEFRCNPVIYKNFIYAVDCDNDTENNIPLLYCYSVEKNKFETQEIS